MSLVLPITIWPEADRAMWERLLRRGGPLDDNGALSHLRATSLATLEHRYGRWLGWLVRVEPESLLQLPADRATLSRLMAWLEALRASRSHEQADVRERYPARIKCRRAKD